MSSFTKLHSGILGSTIWRESPTVKVVWITLLAMADQSGTVEVTIPGLAAFANVSVEETEAAIDKFLSPDKYSRTAECEGRRVEAIEGGWRLINYEKYREKLSKDDLREKATLRQQKHRASVRPESVTERDNSVTECDSHEKSRMSRQAEAEAEAEKKTPAPDLNFDGSEWALRTFKAYPTWNDPDATVAPARLSDAYMATIEAEAPSRGGLLKTAEWFLAVVQEFAKQAAGKEPKFILGLEKFLRQGYVEVKMPRASPGKYVPTESDEEYEARTRKELRERRRANQEAVSA